MTGCEALVGAALFACLADNPACLLPEHERQHPFIVADLKAIAERESRYWPWAIRIEATRTQPGASLFPATYAEAVRTAAEQDARGRTLGLGMFQITHRSNWARHGLTIATAFDPCANMQAGAAHYAGNLRSAALQLYNSGRINGAPAYAAAVLRQVEQSGLAPQNESVVISAPKQPPAPRPADPRAVIAEAPAGWHAAVAMTLGGLPP